MSNSRRHCRGFTLSCALISIGALTACFGPPPTPRMPTGDRIAASHRNIGIPYGPYVVFRGGDRYIALRVTASNQLGNRIGYEWAATGPGLGEFASAEQGRGSAEESGSVARIAAGPLLLNWSRGSGEIGWIYWPDDALGVAVCSRTFSNLEDLDLESKRLRWYTREDFE